MKTKIPFRRDADVLVATSKRFGQFDQPVIIPMIKAVCKIFDRIGNFFNSNGKMLFLNAGNVKYAHQYSESADGPSGSEKLEGSGQRWCCRICIANDVESASDKTVGGKIWFSSADVHNVTVGWVDCNRSDGE